MSSARAGVTKLTDKNDIELAQHKAIRKLNFIIKNFPRISYQLTTK